MIIWYYINKTNVTILTVDVCGFMCVCVCETETCKEIPSLAVLTLTGCWSHPQSAPLIHFINSFFLRLFSTNPLSVLFSSVEHNVGIKVRGGGWIENRYLIYSGEFMKEERQHF